MLLLSVVSAQQPSVLLDVNATPLPNPGSAARDFASRRPLTLFSAASPAGRELMGTFGTAGSSFLVKDIRSGLVQTSSDPQSVTATDADWFFTADDGVYGRELWASDGTAGETRMVVDLGPGDSLAGAELVAFGRRVFFVAPDPALPAAGSRLWISDGTAVGTGVVAALPAEVARPVIVGGFAVCTIGQGSSQELWRTDGSAVGTQRIAGLPRRSSISRLGPALGGFVYFAHESANLEPELWRTDGTIAGTQRVMGFGPAVGALQVVASGNRLFCLAGTLLYVSDGTATGTVLVGSYIRVHVLIPFGNDLVIGSASGTHFTDGTAGGSITLSTTTASAGLEVAGRVVFAAETPTIGSELWVTDGTPTGTGLLADIWPGSESSLPSSAEFALDGSGQRALFAADNGVDGEELWATDGTASGTHLVDDLLPRPPGSLGSNPRDFTDLYSVTLFRATTAAHGEELWRTDGTAAGTAIVADIVPGPRGSSPLGASTMQRAGGLVLFAAGDPTTGTEPWVTDGSPAGTRLLLDIERGSGSSWPSSVAALGNTFVFAATASATGTELWFSDGAVTTLADLWVGSLSSNPAHITAASDYAVFSARTPGSGSELWRTDGTPAGTRLLADLRAGSSGSGPHSMIPLGHRVFFATSAPAALWVTDGSTQGTQLLSAGAPTMLGALDDAVLFSRWDSATGTELWRSDGTLQGTRLLLDIEPGPLSSFPGVAWGFPPFAGMSVRAGSRAYFYANQGAGGRELWSTDGTARGTRPVADLVPSLALRHYDVAAVGSRHVVFRTQSPVGPQEIWWSDGSAQGTRLLGSFSRAGVDLGFAGGQVVFAASGPNALGSEPWVLDPGALARNLGGGCGAWLRVDDPVLGQTAQVRGGAVPGSAGVVLLSAQVRPVSLQPAPCTLFLGAASMAAFAAVQVPRGVWSTSMRIPATPALNGLPVAVQAVFGPGSSGRGVGLTNGAWLWLGL